MSQQFSEVDMTDKRREILANYLDQRVVLTGVFARLTLTRKPANPYKVALLQDVEVELSRAKYDLGHVWIQHAETLSSLNQGDRIQCSCRVGQYRKTLAMPDENGRTMIIDYSLSWPSEVKLLGRPVAFSTVQEKNNTSPPTLAASPAPPPPAPAPSHEEIMKPIDPVQLILKVKELAEKMGGTKRILELQEFIDGMGGWEQIMDFHRLTEEVGGWKQLEQLLNLLKL